MCDVHKTERAVHGPFSARLWSVQYPFESRLTSVLLKRSGVKRTVHGKFFLPYTVPTDRNVLSPLQITLAFKQYMYTKACSVKHLFQYKAHTLLSNFLFHCFISFMDDLIPDSPAPLSTPYTPPAPHLPQSHSYNTLFN